MWYTLLETGRDIRVSPRMLDRISIALRLSDEEKTYLFSLAIVELPVLPKPTLQLRSQNVLATVTSMRTFSQRLWAATTERQILGLTREQTANQVKGSIAATRTRLGLGCWQYEAVGDDENRGGEVLTVLSDRWGPAILDDIHLNGQMTRPGELLTRPEHEALYPEMAVKRHEALAAVDWNDVTWAMASIQSQHGFVSRLIVFHKSPYVYSEIDRALVSTIADLSSLALSGCVS